MAAITTTDIQNYLAANPGMSDATIASLMDQYGVSPAQVAAATGLSTEAVQSRYAPSVTFSASRDSGEGGQTGDQYFINGQAVNPTYTYSSGGAYDAAPNATIGGYTGSITHIGDQDYVPHYNASGQLTGYTPYAGGSWLDSGLVEMAKFLGPAIISGGFGGTISSALGGATGLTGAPLSALTGATLGAGSAALTGQDVLKGALVGGTTGYLTGGGLNSDVGINSNLTPAAIDSGLGTEGYGFNASAASSGLFNPAVIGSGAYTQTSYPYDMADFAAADALQLQSQVGNNLPAIEQNLVASGVDPLVASDIANQVTLNPSISQNDLTQYINTNLGGGNIYDVNTATQYPTSVLPDKGGLLTDIPGYVAPTVTPTVTPTATGLTNSQISSLLKTALTLAGTGAVTGALTGNKATAGTMPTQTVPTGNQDYYNAIQQYYNAYMPAAPRDVVTPLQNWYDNKYGSGNVAAPPVSTSSATSYPQPVTQAPTSVNQAPVQAPVAQASPNYLQSPTGLFSGANTAENQLNTLLASPTLNNLPASAVSAITNAVMSPRSYEDVLAGGVDTPSNLTAMSPEIQKAYELYQQSMVMGAPSSVINAAYAAAGVNPASPDAFFDKLGLTTGTPTKEALAKYAPMALDQFAKTGAGALTFAVDPATIPASYKAPSVSTLATRGLDAYANSILGSKLSDARKQELITARAAKYGVDPTMYFN